MIPGKPKTTETVHGATPAQIRAARALLNWTQTGLARRAGVARKTVADLEGSRRVLQRRTLLEVIRACESAGVMFEPGGVRCR